jgi:hypothetical protein
VFNGMLISNATALMSFIDIPSMSMLAFGSRSLIVFAMGAGLVMCSYMHR